jgi:ParB family transcriptional regulator, chromosome partitioning protein
LERSRISGVSLRAAPRPLAANIASIGLLQAVVITPDGLLICGERRLHAAKLLRWTTIPVTIRGKP